MNTENTAVVVPWHRREQLDLFLNQWGINEKHPRLVLSQDIDKSGCAVTKNRGILEAARRGFEQVVILDDDCFPERQLESYSSMDEFVELHMLLLEGAAEVEMSIAVTDPPSRGTPYQARTLAYPVAAVMGFWTNVGDYDACAQLVHGARHPMTFDQRPVFGRYFPLCGMNLSFSLKEWPWCRFLNVSRFDDIWQGWLWQKKAYDHQQCFRLNGPMVRHSRQSNVWANLRDEAVHLEVSESLWQTIATLPPLDYEATLKMVRKRYPELQHIFVED